MRINCFTLFDITETRVKSHAKNPTLANACDWAVQRNQQRNWDTFIQIISLRAQPFDIKPPIYFQASTADLKFGKEYQGLHRVWQFSFDLATEDAYRNSESEIGQLDFDAAGVPLIVGLTETARIDSALLTTTGTLRNTYFEVK